MSYKIMNDLPWKTEIEDNIFSVAMSSSFADSNNPNGLYYGFLFDGVFLTSEWKDTRYVNLSIPSEEIELYLPLEYFDTQTEKNSDNDPENNPSQKDEEVINDLSEYLKEILKDFYKKEEKNKNPFRFPQDNNIWRNPYTSNPFSKDKDAYKSVPRNPWDQPIMILSEFLKQ